MALQAGDAACTTGLAKRMHDAMLADLGVASLPASTKAFLYALARAIVAEVQANAVVTTPVAQGGLQRVGGNPTDAPAAPVPLTGSIA